MNFLFIDSRELSSDGRHSPENGEFRACLLNARARQAIEDHALKEGIIVACVVEALGTGKAFVESCSSSQVNLEIKITKPLLPRTPLHLAVAYPRPQTVKKILNLSASFGIQSLSFVRTSNVVPGYMQSKSHSLAEVRRHFMLGCEQSGDGIFPELNYYDSLNIFISSPAAKNCCGRNFFGHASESLSNVDSKTGGLVLLGPEAGLTEQETYCLQSNGFIAISLGSRSQRVEVAAAMLLSRLL